MTALATANGVLWVIAPLLAWNTGRAWPQMIAVSMVLADSLMVFTQFGHRLRQAAVANTPYLAAAALFALHMQKTGEFWPFMICILVMGAALATNVLFSLVHRMLIERYQSKPAALIGELEAAREVWKKKFGVAPQDEKEKAKQMRFLQSRGFGLDVVFKVLRVDD